MRQRERERGSRGGELPAAEKEEEAGISHHLIARANLMDLTSLQCLRVLPPCRTIRSKLITARSTLISPVAPVKGFDGTAVDILINRPQTPPVGSCEGRVGHQALLLEIVAKSDESTVPVDLRFWYATWIPEFPEWIVFVSGLGAFNDRRTLVESPPVAIAYSGVLAGIHVLLGVERAGSINTWPQDALAIADDMMHMKVEDYPSVCCELTIRVIRDLPNN